MSMLELDMLLLDFVRPFLRLPHGLETGMVLWRSKTRKGVPKRGEKAAPRGSRKRPGILTAPLTGT